MVRHIIIWNLRDDIPEADRSACKAEAKSRLEALVGVVHGLISLQVITDMLPSGNGDIMLDSTFESVDALNGYQTHEAHVKAASYVRSIVSSRSCVDYEA